MATDRKLPSGTLLGVHEAPIDWDAVYSEQLPRVYNYFLYRHGNEALAEDLTARTFEKAWAARSRYRQDVAGIATWLFSIARNVGIDELRMSARRPLLEDAATLVADGTPEDEGARASDLSRLRTLVADLPTRDQELLALKYGAEQTNRAIAEVTGLSESNVGTLLHRLVARLRSEW